ncbi:hypothetical protein N7481_001726 [Penicillium waksmanii]|uniref:uncharacterized protein n=1 Tax=Penicillium waksmanii TaxID=69791 RepID=UPI002547C869|nr:uncharacterized protein N7481_001726 [Penicillium waksmanii]KAJ5994749.1 hypothetical protein N7481_001726 [Penicillium waksmanii]
MTTPNEPQVILYDLASTKGLCFSPVVWRIRLMLNYKRIPYRTVFLEFPDIEPTLKELGIAPESGTKYTVPAIQHLPTNTTIMDSTPISQFIEKTYPDPPVPLASDLGQEIEAKSRSVVGKSFYISVMPREIDILSPRAQEFYRRTREATLGHKLEDLLDPEKEEQVWKSLNDSTSGISELIKTNKADGPFILGAKPSYTDFFIAGSLQSAKMVHEDVFHRITQYPGFRDVYEACVPYMDRKD